MNENGRGEQDTEMNHEQAETKAIELADAVWGRLADLYEVYYGLDANVPRQRESVERVLADLMIAYDAWLG